MPLYSPFGLLNHVNEANKLWNEIFGHLNYKYLSNLHEKNMVIGIPKLSNFPKEFVKVASLENTLSASMRGIYLSEPMNPLIS